MDVIAVPPGLPLDTETAGSVDDLFRAAYHEYHYLDDLHRSDRHRFVARGNGRVVGFATARVVGSRAVLANLLVDPTLRGAGIGQQLETARSSCLRALGLSLYTSCTCEDSGSQQLKWAVGMRPVALRIGYRRGVAHPGSWGSSVVFTDETPRVGPVGADRVHEDVERGRTRWIGAHPEPARLHRTPGYVELMTGTAGAARLHEDPGVVYAGVDLDLESGTWLYSFQLRNAAYREGLAERPVILRNPAMVLVPVEPQEVA
ncbi:GNAT family N-acetyltransferase [Streptomyces sp. NPDC050256]|uniref:GNAT family N-acetyltransferase n=1 Tax=unclassified Streptomyces TaxID=2593676 RepID=UPI0037B9CC74